MPVCRHFATRATASSSPRSTSSCAAAALCSGRASRDSPTFASPICAGIATSWSGRAPQRRLESLVATTDGFELAEVDLDLRGGGQLLGTRQAGLSDLRFTRLRSDRALVERARAAADALADVEGPLADEADRLFAETDATAAA